MYLHAMQRLIPHTTDPRWPEVEGGRLAGTFRLESSEGCAVALLGLPDDTGVRLNHGRPGAALGPSAFRAALARYGTTYDGVHHRPIAANVFDAGDVIPAEQGEPIERLAETHRRAMEAAFALHGSGLVVVGVGGGHDLTLPTVAALARHCGAPIGGVNIDPHFDVRDSPGSGMAYRRLIEEGHVDARRFTEFSAGRFVNSREHTDFLLLHRASIVPFEVVHSDTRAAMEGALSTARGDSGAGGPPGAVLPIFVSFDLDAIDGAHAPGVSAMNPMGLDVSRAVQLADAAGRCPGVRHFDLMELSPPYDDPPGAAALGAETGALIPGRTARVAAHLFLTFLAAFAERRA